MARAIAFPVILVLLAGDAVLSQEARQPRPSQPAACQQMFVLRGGNQSVSGDILRECLPQVNYRLLAEVLALPHLTRDDAPAALCYASEMDTPIASQGIGIHHPRFGKALKGTMDALGIECELHTGIPRGDDWAKLTTAFVKKHLDVK